MISGSMPRRAIAAWIAIAILTGCGSPAGDDAKKSPAANPAVTEKKARVLERAATDEDRTTPTPSERIGRTEVQAVDPNGTERMDDAITCLARTIYWEARGESTASMEAVASVVMNRLRNDGFPKTVCAVVRQGDEQGDCQFSWWCDGRSDKAKEDASYAVAKEIARRALNQQLRDRTHGALYFHHRSMRPAWASSFIKTADVGDFEFYRPRREN